jgi:hemolysin activation/secretion protein
MVKLPACLLACLTACLTACLNACLTDCLPARTQQQQHRKQQQQQQQQQQQLLQQRKPEDKSDTPLSTQSEQSKTEPDSRIRLGTLRALGGGPDQPPGGPEGTLEGDQGLPRQLQNGRFPFDRGKLKDRRIKSPSADWTGCARTTAGLHSAATAHRKEDDRRIKSARPEHNSAEHVANSELGYQAGAARGGLAG